MYQTNHYGGIRAVYSDEARLKEMLRIAKRNKELVDKALGKKPKEHVDPRVQYAKPSQR